MILAFDIGNTNIVIGIIDDGIIKYKLRLSSNPVRTVDEYGLYLTNFINFYKEDLISLDTVIISSVVPRLTDILGETIVKYLNKSPYIITIAASLGIDRLMSAVAVHSMYRANCIIVDFGTATTMEAVSERGEFLGGIIFPGVNSSLSILHSSTSQLPLVSFSKPVNAVGTNTEDAIKSGIYYGYIDLIDGIIDRFVSELFEGQYVKFIATGGVGQVFAEGSRHNMTYDEDLILKGIYFLYKRMS